MGEVTRGEESEEGYFYGWTRSPVLRVPCRLDACGYCSRVRLQSWRIKSSLAAHVCISVCVCACVCENINRIFEAGLAENCRNISTEDVMLSERTLEMFMRT